MYFLGPYLKVFLLKFLYRFSNITKKHGYGLSEFVKKKLFAHAISFHLVYCIIIVSFLLQCAFKRHFFLHLAIMSGSSKSSRSYSTPSKQDRVRYFDHFFKNFIRPYGRASEVLSDDIFNKRLTNFNCEFLNRPGFCFSEMSESLPMAWDVVKEKLNMIQKKHINKFDNMMDSLDHDFKTIDNKFLP